MAGNAVGSLAEAHSAIARILTQNIVPFWFARLREPDGRGYRLNHDSQGAWKGPSPKRLVKQARVLWFLSRLQQSSMAPPECEALAAEGFAFLRHHLWDSEHGGFYWEVDNAGAQPTMPDKHVYGQAHALYGVAQYALMSGEPAARRFADEIFNVIETRFHDSAHDGYHEFFCRDWKPCPAKKPGYIFAPPELKLLNSHLHLLEAIVVYDELSGSPLARRRVLELLDIIGRRMIREPHGALTHEFQRDWTPLTGEKHDRVSYGHDLEAIYLLIRAQTHADLPPTDVIARCRRLFAHAWRFGHDERDGGIFSSGPIGQPADDRRKIWWPQAEAALGALELYRVTGEPIYAQAFLRTIDWIVRRQADWTHGEWHAEISPDGVPRGDKADAWKGPYHNGRAMIEALEILDHIRTTPGAAP